MKDKLFYVCLVASIISLFAWFYFKVANPLIEKDNALIEKINGLELKINSLQPKKDSIKAVIDSTHVRIITNEKHYQEVVNTIISQPTSDDYEFIRGCIRQYRSQNDSVNLR